MYSNILKQTKIKEALSFCSGSENFHKFELAENTYTDGIKEMADLCESSWLVTDALITCKCLSKSNAFISVKFKYTPELFSKGIEAKVIYSDGNDLLLHTEELRITDFPLVEITLWYENNTLYLPSER